VVLRFTTFKKRSFGNVVFLSFVHHELTQKMWINVIKRDYIIFYCNAYLLYSLLTSRYVLLTYFWKCAFSFISLIRHRPVCHPSVSGSRCWSAPYWAVWSTLEPRPQLSPPSPVPHPVLQPLVSNGRSYQHLPSIIYLCLFNTMYIVSTCVLLISTLW